MMKLYAGIDLHSNNSVVVVLDERDRVLVERRVANELGRILGLLEPYRDEVVGVVVESTYNWYWLVDGLMEAGYEVRLANTAAIQKYAGLKRTDDAHDAWWLAHVLRLGILPVGYIFPKAERALRDLLRKRSQLVRQRTTNVLSVQNLVSRNTGGRISGNAVKQLDCAAALALGGEQLRGSAIQANVAVMRVLDEQIARIEREVLAKAKDKPEVSLVRTTPGIGEVLGLTIVLEMGPVQRFAKVGRFASYGRCVDSAYVSNGKKKGQGNVKNGNRYLAWAFVEAAHFAARFEPRIKRYYDKKRSRTNAAVAAKAVAHKLARATYHMLKNKEPFDVTKAFG
jgi:transposase